MNGLIRRTRQGLAFRFQSCIRNPLKGLFHVVHWLRRALTVHGIYEINRSAIEFRRLWVSPDDIEFASHRLNGWWRIGSVVGGDWDELSFPFEHFDFYQSFVAVERNSRTWEETPYCGTERLPGKRRRFSGIFVREKRNGVAVPRSSWTGASNTSSNFLGACVS